MKGCCGHKLTDQPVVAKLEIIRHTRQKTYEGLFCSVECASVRKVVAAMRIEDRVGA